MKATIAILLATYNGGRFLQPLLDSLFAQTEQDWQLLVSDDGSTDDTLALLEACRAAHPGRVCLLPRREGKGGSKGNFLYLTRCAADYPYLMYCDQDDVWKPDKIARTLAKMREVEDGRPDVPCLVHTDLAVVNADLSLRHESFFRSSWLDCRRCGLHQLLIQNIVTGCTMMINASLRQLALLPMEEEDMLMHDWWIALLAAGLGRIGFLPEQTILYRQHGGNVVGAKEVRSLRYMAGWTRRLAGNRQSLVNTQRQAAALERAAGALLSPGQRRMVQAYARIGQKGKLGRLLVVARYGIWLTGWKRRIGEILLI